MRGTIGRGSNPGEGKSLGHFLQSVISHTNLTFEKQYTARSSHQGQAPAKLHAHILNGLILFQENIWERKTLDILLQSDNFCTRLNFVNFVNSAKFENLVFTFQAACEFS